MDTPPGGPRSRSLTRLTMRVGLEHLGQSVLLLVSMTFLRSPVLAIFAIMHALPNTNVTNISAYASNVSIGFPLRASKTSSSGTSRKDCPGRTAAGIGGEELRLKLSYKSTRQRPYSGCCANARLFEGGLLG